MQIKLREGQDKVAEYRGGLLAVPAVPGAGKTTVLAFLAAELIAEDETGTAEILIVTYMNSAVANFRRRIGDFLENKGLPRNRGFKVKTLHSLALNILKEKPELELVNADFNIIDNYQRNQIINQLVGRWLANNQERMMNYFTPTNDQYRYHQQLERWQEKDFPAYIKKMISHFKTNLLSAKDLKKIIEEARNLGKAVYDGYFTFAAEIYQLYELALNREGYLDFDDFIVYSLKLLRNDKELQQRIAAKYSFVFEDEAQDSNKLQEELLFLLAGEQNNLVRVGDSNQAIMGTFTAAEPYIFRDYSEREDVQVRSITLSSRSSKDIINLANYFVSWSVEKYHDFARMPLEEKYIKPVPKTDPYPNPRPEGYTIGTKKFFLQEDELKFLADHATKRAEENHEETIAILLPANYLIDELVKYLDRKESSYQYVGRKNIAEEKINGLEILLKYLSEPDNKVYLREVFLRIMNEDNQDDENIKAFIDNILAEFAVEELIYPTGGERITNFTTQIRKDKYFASFYKFLQRLRGWLQASLELPPDELVLFLADRLELTSNSLAISQHLALQFSQILNQHPGWRLDQLMTDLPRIKESLVKFANTLDDMEGFKPEPGIVTLSTFHGAKGLEWDTVYLGALTSDNFQSELDNRFQGEYNYLADEANNPVAVARAELARLQESSNQHSPVESARLDVIGERMRLLYVGITRARKNLLLTTHQAVTEKWLKEPAAAYYALEEYIMQERNKYNAD